LGNAPDALAGSPSGARLIALTYTGAVETSASRGATWSRLTTQQSLARSPAGRSCRLLALSAAAWAPAGAPLVAGTCGNAGLAGIFTFSAGTWRLSGPALPGGLSHDAVDVLALATAGQRTTAILAARSSAGRASVLAAWSTDGGAHWRLSPTLATTVAAKPSVSIWANGSAGLVLSASKAAIIGWQSAGWRALPPLPARTATLAVGPTGRPQALAVSHGTLTAWQVAAGSHQWTLVQTVRVTIPYGSSG
jgi:hypothetical protein